jgi:hypothetical protein
MNREEVASMQRHVRIFALIAIMGALQGCAAAALTAGSIAGSAGISHTLSGIVYKTFSVPAKDLRVATLKSLNLMQIKVTKDEVAEFGWKIEGAAYERQIAIELERITPSTTRMRVVTSEASIFKDAATSTEIIEQTANSLGTSVARAR